MLKEKMEQKNIKIPEEFSAGFGREIVNPEPGTGMAGWGNAGTRLSDAIVDDLMVTCTALCDGESIALIYSSDTLYVSSECVKKVAGYVMENYGIPAENLLITVTHSHSAPTIGSNARWLKNFYQQFNIAVEEALRDLTLAKAYTGKGYTQNLNFVRRYLMPDGSYKTNAGSTAVAHESVADNELRTVRFVREGKKDVLMTNWQAHYMGGLGGGQLSADIFGDFRKLSE